MCFGSGGSDARPIEAHIRTYAAGHRHGARRGDAQEFFHGLAYELFKDALNGSSSILARQLAGHLEGEIPHSVVACKIGADLAIFFDMKVLFDVLAVLFLAERRESRQFPLVTIHNETECLGEKAVKIPHAVGRERSVKTFIAAEQPRKHALPGSTGAIGDVVAAGVGRIDEAVVKRRIEGSRDAVGATVMGEIDIRLCESRTI